MVFSKSSAARMMAETDDSPEQMFRTALQKALEAARGNPEGAIGFLMVELAVNPALFAALTARSGIKGFLIEMCEEVLRDWPELDGDDEALADEIIRRVEKKRKRLTQ